MAQLSNRYASAVFDLAMERGTLEDCLTQAVFLREMLSDNDCKTIFTHPRISSTEKKSFLDEAFKSQINDELMGLLHLVVDKNREEFIDPILAEFVNLANRQLRKATAQVVSAVPLRDDQQTRLADLLSRKLDKQVNVNVKVNPAVIGGLYISVDGYFIDRTIKTRLQEMKSEMSEAVLL